MEIMKRFATGRLSEVFGEKFLEIDKIMRLFNFKKLSKETYEKFPSIILEDYSKIINEETKRMKKPFLSKILKIELEEWKPSDTYLIFYSLIFDLNRNLKQELFFLKTAGKVKPEVLSGIFHPAPGKKCIKKEEIVLLKEIPEVELSFNFDILHNFQHWGASNGFGIGKTLSETGNPFLCIDPHLSKSTPPNWYLAKVKIDGREICGATIPGIPAILIGHTEKIAWGFTSSLADIIDLKIIKSLKREDFQKREEVIKIKGGKEVKVDYWERDGDVLISKFEEGKEGILLKFFRDISISPFQLFKEIYESENIYQSAPGFANLPIVLNCILLDRDGNLGHIISGKIPKRTGASGFFPSKEIQWDGSINNYELFTKYDRDYIISANEERGEKISLSWCAPYRYRRLLELIPKKKWDFEDLKELQRDVHSKQAEEIFKILLQYFPEGKLKERFQNWDFSLNINSEEAYFFETFYYKLFENLLEDELGKFYIEYLKITPLSYPALDEAILEGDRCPLWDDVNTPQVEKMSNIVKKTVEEVEKAKPIKWGKVHKLKIGYLFLSKKFPYPGDLNTINLGGFMPEIDFKVVILPSLRFIVEMKEKPYCHFELPGGQSEHIFDKNSMNFLRDFLLN
ncbi:MAG: penicillin acylase family protein, partial [Thermoanaerobaculia bacterium]